MWSVVRARCVLIRFMWSVLVFVASLMGAAALFSLGCSLLRFCSSVMWSDLRYSTNTLLGGNEHLRWERWEITSCFLTLCLVLFHGTSLGRVCFVPTHSGVKIYENDMQQDNLVSWNKSLCTQRWKERTLKSSKIICMEVEEVLRLKGNFKQCWCVLTHWMPSLGLWWAAGDANTRSQRWVISSAGFQDPPELQRNVFPCFWSMGPWIYRKLKSPADERRVPAGRPASFVFWSQDLRKFLWRKHVLLEGGTWQAPQASGWPVHRGGVRSCSLCRSCFWRSSRQREGWNKVSSFPVHLAQDRSFWMWMLWPTRVSQGCVGTHRGTQVWGSWNRSCGSIWVHWASLCDRRVKTWPYSLVAASS